MGRSHSRLQRRPEAEGASAARPLRPRATLRVGGYRGLPGRCVSRSLPHRSVIPASSLGRQYKWVRLRTPDRSSPYLRPGRRRYRCRRPRAAASCRPRQVSHGRVMRIWRREGLKVPSKQPKRSRLWLDDGFGIRLRPERRNQVWSWDFVFASAKKWASPGRSGGLTLSPSSRALHRSSA